MSGMNLIECAEYIEKRIRKLERKVAELDNRTSGSIVIGPGPLGYPHERRALDQGVVDTIEKLMKKKREPDLKSIRSVEEK